MEKLPVQSVGWRLFAIFTLCVCGAIAVVMPPQYASRTWEFIRDLYWWFMPLGVIGYAFGFRVRPMGETFWRVYAALFILDMIWRMILRPILTDDPAIWTNAKIVMAVPIYGSIVL